MRLSELAEQDVLEHGPSTSREVANRLGVSVRSVVNALMCARGDGMISDGTIIYRWPDGSGSCAHRPPGPIVWVPGKTQNRVAACPSHELRKG